MCKGEQGELLAVLEKNANSRDEQAEVLIVDLLQDAAKEAREETVDVEEKLPCLVPTGDLLRRVAWDAIEGTR